VLEGTLEVVECLTFFRDMTRITLTPGAGAGEKYLPSEKLHRQLLDNKDCWTNEGCSMYLCKGQQNQFYDVSQEAKTTTSAEAIE
jgi:hypothetical protein